MIITFIILLICIIALISNRVPLGVVGIFCPVALSITNVLSTNDAWGGFSNSATITFAALFVLGGGLAKTSLAEQISNRVLAIDFKGKPNKREQLIVVIFGVVAMIMATLLNAASTVATLTPFIIIVCSNLGLSKQRVIKPVSDIANMWSAVLPIGAGVSFYLYANAILKEVGSEEQFGFFDLALVKAPILLVTTAFILFFGYRLLPKRMDFPNDQQIVTVNKESKLTPEKERLAYGIFLGIVILMILSGLIDAIPLNTTQLAVVGALLMVCSGIETGKEAVAAINWPVVFIVGGFLPMATALNNTGAGELMAQGLQNMMGGQTNPYLLAAVFLVVPLIATQFMNNIVVMNLFMAIEASIAVNIGINPKFAMTGALVAGTIALLTPMASSPSAMSFGSGEYTMKEFFIGGLPSVLIVLAAYLIWVPICIRP